MYTPGDDTVVNQNTMI